jgi:SpoVK/Ycf46/Vps4 family AAA+-type ATPase
MEMRTKMDVLYQEALGDIDDILKRIEALNPNIQAMIDQSIEKIVLAEKEFSANFVELDGKIDELKKLSSNLDTSKDYLLAELALKTKNKVMEDFYAQATEDRKKLKQLILAGGGAFAIVQILILLTVVWLK